MSKTILQRHRRRMRNDERGSVLVIALVMVFVVGVIVAAILSYSSAGLRTNSAVGTDAKSQFAGDGAMQAAVQYLLANPGDHCGINGSTAGLLLQLPGPNGQPASYVTCEAVKVDKTPGTGDQTSDAPQYAILTMGQRANMPSNQGNYNGTQWLGSQQTNEQGVFFQPTLTGYAALLGSCAGSQITWSSFCYKQTGNVVIAGKVFSNSSIGVKNPSGSGTQSFSTSDATKYNFTVRQPCTVSAGAAMSPYPCSVVPYSDTTQGPDPGFTSRGQWAAGQGNLPARATVPACPAGTLVRFTPGWYASAKALNDLFKTCVNADGTSKDFWFQPGVYYFDFQDTAAAWNPASSSQYCGIGVDYPQDTNLFQGSPPLGSAGNPGSGVSAATRQALQHQWCIRGATASNGSPASSNDYRPHVISGALNSVFNPVAALMSATQAASADFVNPNNGLTINGTSSTYAWLSSNSVMVPLTAASADFTGFNNAKQIDGTLASLSLQSSNQTLQPGPGGAASADFANFDNGRIIDGSSATLNLGGSGVPQSPTTATSADFAAKNNATLAPDGAVSTLSLNGTLTSQQPGTAAGAGWLPLPPNNARVIDTSTATLAVGSVNTSQSASGTPATTQTAGVNDFGTVTNATGAPNGTVSSATLTNTGPTITPGTATSSTVSGASDFATATNATGTINTTLATSTYTNNGAGGATLVGATSVENSPTGGTNDFTSPANATTIGTNNITTAPNAATYTSTCVIGCPTGEIRLGYTGSVPASAAITSATLQVRHFQSRSSGTAQVLVQNAAGTTTYCTKTVPTNTSTNNQLTPYSTVDLTGCLTTGAQVNSVKFDYKVAATGGFLSSTTFSLDGMQLLVNYPADTANRTLALSAFAPQLANAANTTVDAARIDVAHKETANANPQLLLSGVNISASNAACNTINLTPSTVGATDQFNLLSQLTTNCVIAATNIAATINGLTATYVTHLSAAGTATVNLDGINLAVTATDTTARTLTLSNMTPVVSTTATNVIDKVTLSFAHQEQVGGLGPAPIVNLIVTPGGGGSCPIPLPVRPALTTEPPIDLTTCLNTPAKLNGASYAYQVKLVDGGDVSQSVTASVDGLSVAVIATDTANQSLALSAPPPAVPTTGVTVDGSTLYFAHQESGGTVSPRLVLSGPNITAGCNTIPLTPRNSLTTDSFNLYLQLTTGCPAITGANIATTLNSLVVTYTTNVTATTGDGTTQSANLAVDGLRVDTVTTNTANHTLSLTVPSPAVPTGSPIDSVSVVVTHQETGNNTSPTLVITPGPTGSTPCTAIPLTPSITLTAETVVVPAGCLNTVTKINGAKYDYVVHLTGVNGDGVTQAATTSVDGIVITVSTTDTSVKKLTLSAMTPAVPTGVTVDNINLQISHQETGSSTSPTLVITPGPTGSTPCTAIPLTPRDNLSTDTVTVPAGCLNTPAKINGATFEYQVHLTSTGGPQSASVAEDGIRMSVISTDTATHTLTLSNLSNQVSTTAGNTVTSAALSFAHQEVGSNMNPTLVITPGGGGTCTFPLPSRAALTTEPPIDVTACLNTPAKLNGASIAYQVHFTDNGTALSGTASVDGAQIAATVVASGTRTLTLSSFGPQLNTTATGWDGLTVKVAHAESAGTNPTLIVTPGGGAACNIPLTVHSSLATDSIVLDSTCPIKNTNVANGITVQYQVTGATNATAALDGVELNASYYKRPYTGTGSQPVVQSPAGACDNSITGAQWIFGGDSHIYVPDATMQLCAGPSPGHPGQPGYNAQQIAVYGVPPTPAVVPSSNTSTGWTTPTNAYQIGEYNDADGTSRLTADIAPASSAKTMTLSGFNATTVPNGMTVTNVTARVSHYEDGNLTAPKISFTNGAGTNCGTTTLPKFTTVQYSPVDVTSCFNTTAKLGGAGATVPVSALYTTGTTNSATNKEHLDGVALDVTFGWTDPNASVAPGFMPESGCITTYPNFDDGYNSPDCALMKWDSLESRIDVFFGLANFPYYDMCDGSAGHTASEAQNGDPHCLPNAQVSFAGTLYAPGAGIALDDQGYRSTAAVPACGPTTGLFDTTHTDGNGSACYSGVNYAIFDRGVIARSVRFNSFKSSLSFNGAIIACGGSNGDPNDPACRGGQVTTGYEETLTGFVCPPGVTMTPNVACAGGQQRVTATVLIPNVAGATPQITSWNANQEP